MREIVPLILLIILSNILIYKSSHITKTELKEIVEAAYFAGQIDYANGEIKIIKEYNKYIWDKNNKEYKDLTFKEGNELYEKYQKKRMELSNKNKDKEINEK